ncbi:MAG: DUF4416 family protein [Candidatus Brocadiia bacterium]
MGELHTPEPGKLFCAMLAGQASWLDEACDMLDAHLSPVERVSEDWPFTATDYYRAEMGEDILRRIISFEQPINPARIVEIKLFTNEVEEELADRHMTGPARPVNLDPGYLTPARLVLATTKNYQHRIYLRRGIYAEVTLGWQDDQFTTFEWTYPDYSTEKYLQFFRKVREDYMKQR